MKKVIAALVVVAWLMAPAAGFAQDKEKKGSSEEKPEKMMMMGWNMGAVSQGMSQMLEKAGELLDKGNLSPDTQKKMGDVIKEMGKMVIQVFRPQELSRQKDYVDNLKKLQDKLKDIETSAQSQQEQIKRGQPERGGR
jgi:hypothetical protein